MPEQESTASTESTKGSTTKQQKALMKKSLEEIPGFPELDVSGNIIMENVKGKIKEIYETFGFSPLETRLVEVDTVLNRKGIDSKELYTLGRLSKGEELDPIETKRTLALRFDLTVPLSRYIGNNKQEMQFPYKRYQIQKVYRAESSKANRGRFNEFYQSDIDVIGQNSISINYDSEFPVIISKIFKDVFNLEKFVIRISNRKLLEGLFRENGLTDVGNIKKAVNVIDNIEKVSESETLENLGKLGLETEKAFKLLELFKNTYSKSPQEAIEFLHEQNFTDSLLINGLNELNKVVSGIINNGLQEKYFKVDPRIARGLDYYTGTVYETNLLEHMELGSVCSGGRYDDLVSTLTGNSRDIYPGVGVSIGLSRLVPTLIEAGYLKYKGKSPCSVLVTCQDKKNLSDYQRIATQLRIAGIKTDCYLQTNVKLPKQLEYASQMGFKYVILGNKYELDEGKIIVKDMIKSSYDENGKGVTVQDVVELNELASYLKDKLSN